MEYFGFIWQILSFAHKSSLDYLVIMYFVSWYSEMSGKDLVRMPMHFVCMFALLKTKTKTKKNLSMCSFVCTREGEACVAFDLGDAYVF